MELRLFWSLSPNEWQNNVQNSILLTRPVIKDIFLFDGKELKTPDHLRYFKIPALSAYPLNLNDGIRSYKFREEKLFTKHLNKIEKYLMQNKEALHSTDLVEGCHFYTSRTVLITLMKTPYKQHRNRAFNDFTIRVTKFNGKIFLMEVRENQNTNTAGAHHHKFRQYCFADSVNSEAQTSEPVDENVQTYCVYKSQLQNFHITYSGEIAGIGSKEDILDFSDLEKLNEARFVWPKLIHVRTKDTWRTDEKALHFWLQAYTANVTDIYAGYKDKNGYINEPLQQVPVEELPMNQKWKLDTCMTFLYEFLAKVETKMADVNCPYTVFEFKYYSTTPGIYVQVNIGKTEKSFLSEEFVKHLREHQ